MWMVGEQLKDICQREPAAADILDKDLDVEGMSLSDAEKKIKEYADNHRTKNFACVPPNVAEDILREFYGLPERGAVPSQPKNDNILDLADFLG